MKGVQMRKPVHILLVEDNQADIDLTLEAMEEWKLANEVAVVRDGAAAIDYLHSSGLSEQTPRPNLVILDLNLPKKTGLEVLLEIRQNPTLTELPVVILSRSDNERDILGAYKSHVNCFITKPIGAEQFFKAIRAIDAFWLETVELPVE